MKMTKYVIGFSLFIVLGVLGVFLNMDNEAKRLLQKEEMLANKNDTLVKPKANHDTTSFEMPKYDEQAMMQQQQQMMLSQMSPQERAEYMRKYQEYLEQMKRQSDMIKAQKEYERRMNEPVKLSDETQSKVDKLKAEFERKRIQDSITKAKSVFEQGKLEQ